MRLRSDDTGTLASIATAAPIFALLIVLRLGAPSPCNAVAAPPELLVTVQESGWSLQVAGSSELRPGQLGPTSTWVSRSGGQDGAVLRRAARDLSQRTPLRGVRLRAADGVAYADVVWAGDELGALAPVRIDSGPLALADQARFRQARPEGIR